MKQNLFKLPSILPTKIFSLRESSFAADLFIAAVSHLDFFNRLNETSADLETICRSFKIKPRPADVMLNLFKAYGLINEKQHKYCLTDLSKTYLTRQSALDLTSYVDSLQERPVCKDLQTVLRTGKPINWAAAKKGKEWAEAMDESSFAESFTSGMNSRGAYLASGLANTLALKKHREILDIGGASGIYSAVLVKQNPHLRATIFEKPPVDKVAKLSIKNFGLAGKIDVFSGDMFKDALPQGYDLHLISHVLHDWDMEDVKSILRNSYNSLEAGGTIVIHDAHINRSKTGPVSVAEYSVLLMALSRGKCYSIAEISAALKECGFRNIEYKSTILNRSIISAQK